MSADFAKLSQQKQAANLLVDLFEKYNIPEDIQSSRMNELIRDCSTVTKWDCVEGADGTAVPVRMVNSNSCGSRWCPICTARKSHKNSLLLGFSVKHLRELGYHFSFITFTIPNIKIFDAIDAVKSLNKSFNGIWKNRLSKFYDGYFKKLEFTFKWVGEDLYVHPHIHVLASISPEAWKNRTGYIPQRTLSDLWRVYTHADPGDPCFVDIRTVTGTDESVKEVTKYAFKSQDLLSVLKNKKCTRAIAICLLSLLKNVRYFEKRGIIASHFHFVQNHFKDIQSELDQELQIVAHAYIHWNSRYNSYQLISLLYHNSFWEDYLKLHNKSHLPPGYHNYNEFLYQKLSYKINHCSIV